MNTELCFQQHQVRFSWWVLVPSTWRQRLEIWCIFDLNEIFTEISQQWFDECLFAFSTILLNEYWRYNRKFWWIEQVLSFQDTIKKDPKCTTALHLSASTHVWWHQLGFHKHSMKTSIFIALLGSSNQITYSLGSRHTEACMCRWSNVWSSARMHTTWTVWRIGAWLYCPVLIHDQSRSVINPNHTKRTPTLLIRRTCRPESVPSRQRKLAVASTPIPLTKQRSDCHLKGLPSMYQASNYDVSPTFSPGVMTKHAQQHRPRLTQRREVVWRLLIFDVLNRHDSFLRLAMRSRRIGRSPSLLAHFKTCNCLRISRIAIISCRGASLCWRYPSTHPTAITRGYDHHPRAHGRLIL